MKIKPAVKKSWEDFAKEEPGFLPIRPSLRRVFKGKAKHKGEGFASLVGRLGIPNPKGNETVEGHQ